MNRFKKTITFSILLILFSAFYAIIYAGDTGKITGTVIDKKTGEGIVGANVVLGETTLGAQTDLDGFYTIINVKPGKYNITASSIGYIPMIQKDVVVSIDINSQVNFVLEPTVLEAAAPVEVYYEKPQVDPGVTSSERRITKEDFDVLPVSDVNDMLQIQAGIKIDNEGKMHVRGGGGDEVLFIVGGLEVNDDLGSGRRTFNLPTEAVQEVQIMTGSYDAEYSNALSGVVNQSLETGSEDKYSGRVTWETDRLWNEYSFDTDRFDINFGGPIPLFKVNERPVTFNVSAWGDISNTYTPFDINRPNSDVLNIGVDIPERQDNLYGYMTNTVMQVDETKKLTIMFGGGHSKWDPYPNGDVVSGNYGYQYKYNVANRPYIEKSESLFNLTFTNQLSNRSFYDVSIGRYFTNTNIRPRNATPGDFTMQADIEDYFGGSYLFPVTNDNNGNAFADGFADADGDYNYTGWGEGYEDINFNGQWDRGEDWVDANGNGVYDGGIFDPFTGTWLGEPILDDKNGDGVWNPGETFVDLNGNGIWDPAEQQLSEQDWNRNGRWDGERYQDANGNGQYDGYGEGYDDFNLNGACDIQMLFSSQTEDSFEPWYDGDLWYDTGEPFFDKPRMNEAGELVYNGIWDFDELWIDLPSSYTSLFGIYGLPTLNGQYDGPNGYFDEYELFCRPNALAGNPEFLQYGMDASEPVIYNFSADAHGSDWLSMNYYGMILQSTWMDRNNDDIFNPPNFRWDEGEFFEDYNDNGVWNGIDYFLNPGTWDSEAHYENRTSTDYTLKFNYQNQLSKHHTITTGGNFKYQETEMESILNPDLPYESEIPLPPGSPWPDRGEVRDFYNYSPWSGGFFFRDVMEFEGLIVKASMRLDFYVHDKDYLDNTTQLDQDYPYFTYSNRRGRYKIAPRLGISHPITRGSKLFFNYSHKYQKPRFDYYFASATSNLANSGVVGNPDLEYEKTVEYELGVETEVSKYWLFRVSGYYKDIYNTMGTIPQVYGPLDFYIYSNTNYGRAKGVEFAIDKRFSQNYLISFKYDFSFAEGKQSSDVEAVSTRLSNVPENYDEYPLSWDERHRINLYASIRYRDEEHPVLFGVKLPDDWLLTVQWEYGSGVPYTPSYYTTGIQDNLILTNSARYPWSEKTNLKIEKYFLFNKERNTQLVLGIDVSNLFNKKNIRALYAETGSPYYSTSPLNPDYPISVGKYDYDHNPRNFSPGRNVMFRVGFQF